MRVCGGGWWCGGTRVQRGRVRGKLDRFTDSTSVFRWQYWHSYSQNFGWRNGNNGALFGGVAPSTWGDGNGRAYQMSASSDVLLTLFIRKAYGGKNANVYTNSWKSYSSTNSQQVGALFRVKNTTGSTVTWTPYFFYSSYSGWGERASVSLNGGNNWESGGNNCAYCKVGVNLSIPGGRTSTVIVVSSTGSASGDLRPTTLAFYNNCLALPNGLEFVDDLDRVQGGNARNA